MRGQATLFAEDGYYEANNLGRQLKGWRAVVEFRASSGSRAYEDPDYMIPEGSLVRTREVSLHRPSQGMVSGPGPTYAVVWCRRWGRRSRLMKFRLATKEESTVLDVMEG